MTRSRQGKFCGGQTPLDLMRDPEDRGHLILDPDTVPVIRKIYEMALNGWGCIRIAKQLMEDKSPSQRLRAIPPAALTMTRGAAPESAISCVIRFIKALTRYSGHIKKGFAPTPMTSSPVRTGKSLRIATRPLSLQRNGNKCKES